MKLLAIALNLAVLLGRRAPSSRASLFYVAAPSRRARDKPNISPVRFASIRFSPVDRAVKSSRSACHV